MVESQDSQSVEATAFTYGLTSFQELSGIYQSGA
jgi:hypothetical protein